MSITIGYVLNCEQKEALLNTFSVLGWILFPSPMTLFSKLYFKESLEGWWWKSNKKERK
jgi:hypothetical protein